MGAQGGVIGVTSKSKDESIKIYNGRTQYNEWAFVYIQTAQRPGQAGMPGARRSRPGSQQGQPGPFGMQPGGHAGRTAATVRNRRRDSVSRIGRRSTAEQSVWKSGSERTVHDPNGSTTFTPITPGVRRPAEGSNDRVV